ncbi:MAG TPA: MmgE/PrpD family protein, partial [Anaerolineae bacterium]|nr:MmgE/PrpD family protein [Anaerolineae bacterium]
MDGNEHAAQFIVGLRWESLPEPVRRQARLCLLDSLGALLAGTLTRVGRIAAAYAADTWRGDEATVLLAGRRAQAAGAAFANGCAANALDIDDDAVYTRGHPGAQLFPAALAVAEKVDAGGKALLEALVVGYEIAIRTARAWHSHHETYQACASWGSVACAAASARLLGLDAGQVQHALGIAEYLAPNAPMMRDIDRPAMVKHGIGWGAMHGVTSAELAARGFTGIPSILGFDEYRDWVADLGSRYSLAEGGVNRKRWCSCAWGHAAIHATLKLLRSHGIRVSEIARIRLHTFHEGWRLWQQPPTSTEEAQFSIKWPLATMLLDGQVGPDQVLEPRLDDPALNDLIGRIEVVEDPEINRMYRLRARGVTSPDARIASRAQVTLTDGRSFDSGIVDRESPSW